MSGMQLLRVWFHVYHVSVVYIRRSLFVLWDGKDNVTKQTVLFAYDKQMSARELALCVSVVELSVTLDFCTTAVVRTGMCHVKAVFMIEVPC